MYYYVLCIGSNEQCDVGIHSTFVWIVKGTQKNNRTSFAQAYHSVQPSKGTFCLQGCTGVPSIPVQAVPFMPIGIQQLHGYSCCA